MTPGSRPDRARRAYPSTNPLTNRNPLTTGNVGRSQQRPPLPALTPPSRQP